MSDSKNLSQLGIWNHRDLDTLNNNAENLEWASRHENEAHKRFWKAHEQLAGERICLT
jgi:hypothetical protein